MLHRSFKPAKCKTALKLAIPRIKLMKNKREAQVKQLKRELAQLLESGQDQTARIRVEHVVREEKTVAAYNLLGIYCELIVARMPIIESQKNCPIDLKEAISSVIFASARCEEVPELKDVSKHFTAKYGKEFTSAALELRPNCGVGRMLVEKLSANAPDGPTKLKILTAIAEEHNIKWDPESFGAKESKIYEDLLVKRAKIEYLLDNLCSFHMNLLVQKWTKSRGHQNFGQILLMPMLHPVIMSRDLVFKILIIQIVVADNSMSSGTCPPNSKPHGTENHRMQYRNSYPGNESALSSSRQHWNMEFKDATAAAQAAAESAEQASMAARAAAELSSRGNISQHQQYSTESHMSSAHSMREEEPRKYTGSASHNEHLAKHPVNISRYENSYKSTAASFNEKPSLNDQIADAYSQRNSSEGRQMKRFAEMSMKKLRMLIIMKSGLGDNQAILLLILNQTRILMNHNSGESRMPFVNELHETKNSDSADYQEEGIRKQSSYSSSHSLSSTFSDDHDVVSNLNQQELGNNSGEDSFLLNDKGSLQRSAKETIDSHDNASAVFDDYGSDIDECKFDLEEEHKVHEYSMNFSSPVQRSPTHPFTSTNPWSVEQNVGSPEKSISQSHIFSEQQSTPVFFEGSTGSAVPSHGDDLPATFDDYGPGSESEEEVDKSKFVRTDPSVGSHKKNIDSHQAENSIFPPKLAKTLKILNFL
ncbi:uncharacterized protein LOC111300865 [Durio zibethinus]|uniref:Uncharacterized protein LOC111300865 n=1 Tax=Durio zibethinus TaxID=66656 RepID=A0A6P5ZIJ2_DURZI|nr:uncharacterized protein LOC111300865 [Durio zibethinus]